ncbi:hypothetical protein GE09DRAFT_1219827 [Coniochaeta sp. 2T2.1]|nr:hypothetical protein GE09DRAFT_1219827 [Coniochaeta sp. 2T2.1]
MATDSATPEEQQSEHGSSPSKSSQHLPSPDKKSKAPKTSHHSPTRLHRGPAVRRVSSLLSLASSTELDRVGSSVPTATVGSLKNSSTYSGNSDTSLKSTASNHEHPHFLDRDSAPSLYTSAIPEEDDGEAFFVREADRIWHAPSVDQMVDSLKVGVMTMSGDTLPRKYTGHVHVLLEGYAKLKKKLKKTQEKAEADLLAATTAKQEELKQTKEKAAAELLKVQTERVTYLGQLNTAFDEIKRLELMISNYGGGVENVMVARAGSLIDRGIRKSVRESFKRLSKDQSCDTSTPAKTESTPAETRASDIKPMKSISINTGVEIERRMSKMLIEEKKKELLQARKRGRRSKGKRTEDSRASVNVPDDHVPRDAPPMGKGETSNRPQRHGRPGAHAARRERASSSSSTSSDDDLRVSKRKEHERSGQVDDNDDTIRFNFQPTQDAVVEEDVAPASDASSGWGVPDYSSSDDDLPVMRGKGAGRTAQMDDAGQSNKRAAHDPTTGSGTAGAGYRSPGELAIKRFLATSDMPSEPVQDGGIGYTAASALEAIDEDYFSLPRRRDDRERRRISTFSFIAGDDDSLALSPLALQDQTHRNDACGDPNAAARPSSLRGSMVAETVPVPDGVQQPNAWSPEYQSNRTSPHPSQHYGGQPLGDGHHRTEALKQECSPASGRGGADAGRLFDEIRQPRPRSPWLPSTRKSGARQLQQGTETEFAPAVTTPLQAVGTLVTGTALTTPSTEPDTQQSRPTSTGSVVYHGNRLSTAGSRDSTSSIATTVLRANSGQSTGSRRQAGSHSRTTSSDQPFESANESTSPTRPSPAMSPIPEGRRPRLDNQSPTPSSRRRSNDPSQRSTRGGVRTISSSTMSSPIFAPAAGTDSGGGSRLSTPLHLPASAIPVPTAPRRNNSGAGGSEASAATTTGACNTTAAANAARIAAMLAVQRSQKRRESDG